jgi:peptide/nickel transport system substrate-binding protein
MFKKSLLASFVIWFVAALTLTGCFQQNPSSESAPDSEEDQAASADHETSAREGEDRAAGGVPGKLEYKQAPMLEGRDLPPVAERLPREPKLVNEMPDELLQYEIGKYGGTLRTVTSTVDTDLEIFVMATEPLLNTPGILGEEITGNVLKGYEVTSDQKEFTFYMREGLKWSDGQPVTVEDVRFTVEDVLFNEELTPIFPSLFRSGGKADGEPMKLEVIDDYTFKLIFAEPYGGLPIRLAIQGWRGYTELLKPAHFLKPYHKDYADPESFAAKLKEAGLAENQWMNLFHDKDITNWELTSKKAIGFPVLYPWMIVNSSQSMYEFERNPYYFKVDAEGNQLPYIDKLQSTLVQDVEMVTMKTIAGEVDFLRIATALNKMPLYKENEDKGYRTIMADMHITPTDVFLNLTHEDPVWRKVVRDIRFRQALNLALDRDEIIDSIYYGFAEPSIFIDPTFNPDEANRLLDEMGMKVGPDGYRQSPDGEPFMIPFEVGAQAPDIVPLTELIVEMWKKLKLNVTMKTIDQTLWGTRNNANELKATMIWTHTPLWYMADWGQGFWGPLWNRWYNTDGLEGEQPPEEVLHFYDLINKVSVSSPDEARAAIEEVKREMGEHLWYFVHIENVKQPLIVNKRLGNISEKGMAISTHFSGETFFFNE